MMIFAVEKEERAPPGRYISQMEAQCAFISAYVGWPPASRYIFAVAHATISTIYLAPLPSSIAVAPSHIKMN